MRRPAYKTLVYALETALSINTDVHNGEPPSWCKDCPKCAAVRVAKDVLERAKRKPKKARSK